MEIRRKSFGLGLFILSLIISGKACKEKSDIEYKLEHDIEIGIMYAFECSYLYNIDCRNNYVISHMEDSIQSDTFPVNNLFCDSMYSMIHEMYQLKDSKNDYALDGLFFFVNYRENGKVKIMSFKEVPDLLGLKKRNAMAYEIYLKMQRFTKHKNCIP